MEEVIIYTEPLSDEEFKKHSIAGDIRKAPIRYHLIDCLKEMKFGRPAEAQKALDGFIAFLELSPEKGVPFSPEQIGLVWNENDNKTE